MSSTANICKQEPLCRAHTWPSHPCTWHPSSHSAQGNSAPFLNAQVSLIILMTALLNKTKQNKNGRVQICGYAIARSSPCPLFMEPQGLKGSRRGFSTHHRSWCHDICATGTAWLWQSLMAFLDLPRDGACYLLASFAL